jgi:hypothetical protein
MSIFFLFDDKWLDYCDSFAPVLPRDVSLEILFPLVVCSIFAIFLITSFIWQARIRKRIVTPEEFAEAYQRIVERIPHLKTRRGADLHWLCRAISRDLLQITGFVTCDVTRCIRKHYSGLPRGYRRLTPIIALLRENDVLRRSAVNIAILYRIKPLRSLMVRETNESVEMFSTTWLQVLAYYCKDNLQHGRF